MQPVAVGVLGGELALDLLVVDDAPARGVDEEHLAGLQPTLAHDPRSRDVEHADLRGQDDPTVGGLPPAAGAQAVAVEHGADERAVGERHAGRSVPRLHHGGVEAVEVTLGLVHVGRVLPRLRDHHQDGVRERAASHVQQLEDLVEAGAVGGARGADREQARQVVGQLLRAAQQRLAGAHPVAVAAHGVDLAVVRDVAVGVRQRPARERVRREAAVHQHERADEPRVGQVGEERLELPGREHPLVDEGARRQRREVGAGLVLRPLARDVGATLQRVRRERDVAGNQDELVERRHDRACGGAEPGPYRVHGQLAPRQRPQPLLLGDRVDARHDVGPLRRVVG